ncbi:MAG TPA: alpha/beta hydrolase [Acidimicrobiales bacterium]|jgi:pimeloyl-ACP methyl ester carboxylesterase
MTTIALVHGAYHGGWCWDHLVPLLRARGFETVAPDLPCDDAGAGIDEYAAVVEAALEGQADVVLVGHSLGSLTIPVVASRRPIRRMIFLCSVPTGPGPAIDGQLSDMVSDAFVTATRFHDEQGRELLENSDARGLFFDDCSAADASWAVSMLRPQSPRPLVEPSPLRAWPATPQSVVLTSDDRVLNREWAVAAARERLAGPEPILLPGSHSPFLSRPPDLADVLAEEARR